METHTVVGGAAHAFTGTDGEGDAAGGECAIGLLDPFETIMNKKKHRK